MSCNTIYTLFYFLYKSHQSVARPPLSYFSVNKRQIKYKNRVTVWDFAKLSCSNYESPKNEDGKRHIISLF